MNYLQHFPFIQVKSCTEYEKRSTQNILVHKAHGHLLHINPCISLMSHFQTKNSLKLSNSRNRHQICCWNWQKIRKMQKMSMIGMGSAALTWLQDKTSTNVESLVVEKVKIDIVAETKIQGEELCVTQWLWWISWYPFPGPVEFWCSEM